ncbi:hypothetical protein HDU85_006312 [Gaertneriomyces sp. JEL0708]|nr:hypothetical protein HDU85_006312 [Gaertneriomyces sp. JEL0708]
MATCAHISSARLAPATASNEVYKDECTLCFDSQDLSQGIDVCLSCFNGGCLHNERQHAQLHYRKTKHPIVLNIKRIAKPKQRDGSEPPAKITKLAIEEERDEDMFDFITTPKCYECGQAELDPTTEQLAPVIASVMTALSAKKQSEVKAWQEEIISCAHTQNLEQGEKRPLEAQVLAHCNQCELKDNLWLCLTCGNLGCGRQQYGGVGGNGHGLAHYESCKHPVAVKLGTITPEGTADVFCYHCGEERVDPQLGKHLANFGINIAQQQKTEKSLTELQVEQNLKFDFSMTTEDGKMLEPLFGPGYTGMKNLGNSCYMASVLQALFALEPFQRRYNSMADHVANCYERPAQCFQCQMAKLADGVLSGRYSQPKEVLDGDGERRGQEGITPSMFKALVGKGHPEFSTMRQQDAQEFFQHITSLIEQKERSSGSDVASNFKFSLEQRLQCLQCERVRYGTEGSSSLTLRVPAKKKEQPSGSDDTHKSAPFEPVDFQDCLATVFNDDIRDYKCPHDKCDVQASYTTRFKTFPEILVCTMSRFVLGADWVTEKLTAQINAPLELDLERLRGHGHQENEELFAENSDESDATNPQVDDGALQQLMSMGFPEIRCRKALLATGNNGAEVAMNWLFEHMDDPDIDTPLAASSAGVAAASNADIQQLADMGFTPGQAKRALAETGNNMERAVDWLFSHADAMDTDETPAEPSSVPDTRPAKYRLTAFVSHKGTSTHCGHYVAHCYREGRWALYNDNKVVEVPDISKAIGEAYMYIYSRVA